MRPDALPAEAAASQEGYVDWKGWTEDRFGSFDRHAARYFRWHTERALAPRPGLRVLELGFGNGAFLGYCRHRGWQASAVELDPRLRERAAAAGFPTYARVEEIDAAERYDLIALFDVLEHIPAEALVPFVRTLEARLADGGAILLRVPNGDSPFGGRHQHGDLTHITSFGEIKLIQLAGLCSLKLAAIGEAPWHAQQTESRNLRSLMRAATRAALNRLLGWAYYGTTVDLLPNLTAVLVRDAPAAARVARP